MDSDEGGTVMNIILQLIRVFFLIGTFSFGGGMASMEVIRSRVVTENAWLSDSEFTDIISISEMTPGPLGINIASFTGTRIAGIPGTLAATLSYCAAPLIIVMIMAWFYYRYREMDLVKGILKSLRPAVAAMILSSCLKLTGNAWWGGLKNISLPNTNIIAVCISLIFLVLIQKKKISPVPAILLSGLIGAFAYALTGIPA